MLLVLLLTFLRPHMSFVLHYYVSLHKNGDTCVDVGVFMPPFIILTKCLLFYNVFFQKTSGTFGSFEIIYHCLLLSFSFKSFSSEINY